jgi:hypothetical protein
VSGGGLGPTSPPRWPSPPPPLRFPRGLDGTRLGMVSELEELLDVQIAPAGGVLGGMATASVAGISIKRWKSRMMKVGGKLLFLNFKGV